MKLTKIDREFGRALLIFLHVWGRTRITRQRRLWSDKHKGYIKDGFFAIISIIKSISRFIKIEPKTPLKIGFFKIGTWFQVLQISVFKYIKRSQTKTSHLNASNVSYLNSNFAAFVELNDNIRNPPLGIFEVMENGGEDKETRPKKDLFWIMNLFIYSYSSPSPPSGSQPIGRPETCNRTTGA